MFKCALVLIAYFICGSFGHVKVLEVTPCAKFKSEYAGLSLATSFANGKFGMNISTPFKLDDDVKVKFQTFWKENGKWNESAIGINMNLCSLLDNYFKVVWAKALKLMKLKSCPIPKGSYSLSGLTATYQELGMEYSENTEYLYKIMFVKDDKAAMCREVRVMVTEDAPNKT